MKLAHRSAWLLFLLSPSVADECQPSTWGGLGARTEPTGTTPLLRARTEIPIAGGGGDLDPGDVHCRRPSRTSDSVNYYTCYAMAEMNRISPDLFFTLNPTLNLDCSNIEPDTEYCVDGCESTKPPIPSKNKNKKRLT
jgi:hypothetical protein